MVCNQVGSLDFNCMPATEKTDLVQHFSEKPGNGGFSGAGVACENHMHDRQRIGSIRCWMSLIISHQRIQLYQAVFHRFQADQSLIHEGKRYGVPYNCGPYGLAYNTEVVKEAPASWNILWDPQYAGKYTINNNFPKCNIWITALALGYTYDQIFDVNKLDRAKIQEKLDVLAKNAKSLWDGEANPDEFPELSLATTWGFAAQQANLKGGKWLIASPKEGGTAWMEGYGERLSALPPLTGFWLAVLFALLPAENEDLAETLDELRRELISGRQTVDLSDPNWFRQIPGLAELKLDPKLITTSSDLFRVESTAAVADATTTVTAVMERVQAAATGRWTCRILAWQVK